MVFYILLHLLIPGVLAVTRALGDTYMKDYISGHPFTTETILSNSSDEFMILACDGVQALLLQSLTIVMGRLCRSNCSQLNT